MKTFKDLNNKKEVPLREKFMRGDILRIGQIVEDNTGKYQILDRGTNYVVCADMSGNIVKKFISEVSNSMTKPAKDTVANFKGFVYSFADPIVESCFASTIDKYNSGQIVDSVAILKAMKAYSLNDGTNLNMSLSRINELDNHIYLKEKMDNIKPNDKLKVAEIIADTLGADTSGSSPETMVNNALRNARKNSMTMRGESMKIIHRMLELAKSVGIKYDESLVPKEKIEELSTDTLARYKKKAAEYASAADKTATMTHRMGDTDLSKRWTTRANKKFSGIMQATKKQFANDLKEGENISVTHESGRKVYGTVKGKHGSVIEVQYKNGKIGFHHSNKVDLLNELDPVNEVDSLKTFEYNMPKSGSEDTEENLKKAIAYSAGIKDSDPEDPEDKLKREKYIDSRQGHSLGPSNNTHRNQLINKLHS